MSFSPVQRHRAIGLYKRLLRTSRNTFQGDQLAIAAARDETRKRFKQATQESDPQKIDQGLDMGDDIVTLLRQNVVQGKWKDESQAFQLQITKDTELGSNDSIQKAREQQIADLKAGKAPSKRSCRQVATEIQAEQARTASIRSARTISTLASQPASPVLSQLRAFSTSSVSFYRDPTAAHSTPLPRPVPKFSSVTILADGSSIQLTTTSPRRTNTLTRDPTNHPLWNPGQDRKVGGDGSDDSGRLGRFRRRFADVEVTETSDKGATDDLGFGQDDLSWMSAGGREARAGTPLAGKKGAKGKGKK